MSYTTVLSIYPGDRFEELETLRNSHLSAPPVWDAIWNAYGEKRHEHDISLLAGDRLWALHKDPRLSDADRAVFMMTFDRAYVTKPHYEWAAAHIAAFMVGHNVGGHWVRIRDIFLSDPDSPAIGFHFTSVSGNPFQGEWDEEAEDHRPIDWSTAWSVYDEEVFNAGVSAP